MSMEAQASDKLMRRNLAPKRAPVETIALALVLLPLLAAPTTHAGLFRPKGDGPEEEHDVVLKQRDLNIAAEMPAVGTPALK